MSNNYDISRFKRILLLEALFRSAVFSLLCAFFVCLVSSVICYFTHYSGLALTLILGGGALIAAYILFFLLAFRPTEKKLALRLDRMGLGERAITMLQLKNNNSFMAVVQRTESILHISKFTLKQFGFKGLLVPLISLSLVCSPSVFMMTQIPPVNASTPPATVQPETPIPPDDEEEEEPGLPSEGGETPQTGGEKSIEDIINDLYEELKDKVNSAEVEQEVKDKLNDVIEELDEKLKESDSLEDMLDALADASQKISEILQEELEGNADQQEQLEELKESLDQSLDDAAKQLEEGEMPDDAEEQPGGNPDDTETEDDEEQVEGGSPEGEVPDGNEGEEISPNPDDKVKPAEGIIDGTIPYDKLFDEYYDMVMEMLKGDDISDEVRAIIEKYFGIIG